MSPPGQSLVRVGKITVSGRWRGENKAARQLGSLSFSSFLGRGDERRRGGERREGPEAPRIVKERGARRNYRLNLVISLDS